MTTRQTENKNDQHSEADSLMDAYNPPPIQPQTQVNFYWQESWHDAGPDDAVQAAFEN